MHAYRSLECYLGDLREGWREGALPGSLGNAIVALDA